ncbi:hypothetical protein J2S43_001072 [Catenuloplanes nepalensis]|uniref:Uncharacterized protein n=1 Tax=Catenuloplanes nepalensis TaxID=587533 RepID=A0ABT9MMA9_9ACTN|nr:hypothetical protein [Catenuloplanes nepalensis]MDP9792560.1 hypothetical protein [Catenuloplanes nepalensis]
MRVNSTRVTESVFSLRGLRNVAAVAALLAPAAGAFTAAFVPPPSVQAVPPPSVQAASIPDGRIAPSASLYTYY